MAIFFFEIGLPFCKDLSITMLFLLFTFVVFSESVGLLIPCLSWSQIYVHYQQYFSFQRDRQRSYDQAHRHLVIDKVLFQHSITHCRRTDAGCCANAVIRIAHINLRKFANHRLHCQEVNMFRMGWITRDTMMQNYLVISFF